jgi:flagellar protein FlaG
MSPVQPLPPRLHLNNTPDYRDSYANSVQMRVNLWDFFLLFGTVSHQSGPDSVTINNFQGVYLSPPQAKAFLNLLQQNVKQYESAFGEIHLEAQGTSGVVQ